MLNEISPYPGYLPANPYDATVSVPEITDKGEFFPTKDCADDDPAIPELRRLPMKAIDDMTRGPKESLPASPVDAHEETFLNEESGSKSLLKASVPDLIITASTLVSGKKREDVSTSAKSLHLTEDVQRGTKQILSTRQERPNVPQLIQGKVAQEQSPAHPEVRIPVGGEQCLGPGSTSDLPVHFYQCYKHPVPLTASLEDAVQVLRVAQQQQYFELEGHFWSSAQLIGEIFGMLDSHDFSPFTSAVRYARSPFANGEPWCDIEVHTKKISREKLDAMGRILLRELDLDYIRMAPVGRAVPLVVYQAIEYTQHPSQRQIDWSMEDVETLVERLGVSHELCTDACFISVGFLLRRWCILEM
ncbi:hypothetical protein PMIN06_005058 [Paraphaeosphaeria minitans]